MIRSVGNGIGDEITIYEANGSLSYEELSNVIEDFYTDKLTPKVILDMTEATASAMSKEDIVRLSKKVESLRNKRPKGKTAIVVKKKVDFGLAGVFRGNIHNEQAEIQPFYSKEAAMVWLEE